MIMCPSVNPTTSNNRFNAREAAKSWPGRLFFSLLLAGLSCACAVQADVPAAPAGDGASFDGVKTHVRVDLEDDADLDSVTVSVWVKLDEAAGIQTFLNRGARGDLFTLYLFNDHVRMLVEHEEGRYRHASTEPPEAGTWTHYAGTYDGETITLYVNGERVDSTAAEGRMPARQDLLFIGSTGPLMNVVDGRLEDVRVYRRALSQDELRQVVSGREPAATDRVLRFEAADLEERMRSDIPGHMMGNGEPELPFAVGEIPATDGFRGIWYLNQRRDDGLHKYSGGLGTYPQQHIPIAVYAEEVNKTFFTYGGTRKDRRRLLHMVSVYDHETGKVARPRILLDKHTTDAHDNPTMAIDRDGYIWIFSNAHGTGRPSYIHRSEEPYSIDAFQNTKTTNYSYSQPWYLDEFGFVFLHTRYAGGRFLYVMSSEDGEDWTEPKRLSNIAHGHYQVSWPKGSTIGTVFNYHPPEGSPLGRGLNYRTNLYYMETADGGKTWRNVEGEQLELPLDEPDNPALAIEYESRGHIIYLKDIQYTDEGHPVILYLTTPGWESGPENDPRMFTVARWTGSEWVSHPVTSADNNYDFASIYLEGENEWRVIGSTETGPQEYNTGGEMAMWLSSDQGRSWEKVADLTEDSEYNHTYPRRPLNAHPGFYAFWADGHGREQSPSRFYFGTRDGEVYRLPFEIEDDDAKWVEPERIR